MQLRLLGCMNVRVLCGLVLLFNAADLRAANTTQVYEVFSDQKKLGTVTQRLEVNTSHRIFSESIRFSGDNKEDAGDYESNTLLKHDELGLYRYEQTVRDGDQRSLHTCVRNNGELWCSANRVLSVSEKEARVAEEVARGILFSTVPYASEASAVLGAFVDRPSVNTSLRLSLDEIDTTDAELPSYLWQRPLAINEKSSDAIRVLSIDDMQVLSLVVTRQADESCEVYKRVVQCRVVHVEGEGFSGRWWLYHQNEPLDSVLPVRVEYKDRSGELTFLMSR